MVVLAHRAGGAVCRGRLVAAWHAVVAGYYLATSRVFIVDDYFFPIYVDPAAPRDDDRPDLARQRRLQEGRLQRAGQVVRDGRGARPAGPASTRTTTSAWSHRRPRRRTTRRRSASRSSGSCRDLGIPRTDVFFGEERLARTREAVRRRYGLTDGRRVVLYAPTFRGDSVTDARATDDLDLDAMRGDARRGPRPARPPPPVHPHRRTTIGRDLAGFAIDVSDHPDINELMLVSDVLVTDYSSAIYEFALLGRPMALLRAGLRGVRARAGLLLRLPDRRARPDLRDDRGARRATCGPVNSTSSASSASGDASFDVADGRSTARVHGRARRPVTERGAVRR